MIKLQNLLPKNNNFLLPKNILEQSISSIEIDSRETQQNSIFFALKGKSQNGHKFIESAIKNGTKIIICEEKVSLDKKIIQINTKNINDLLIFMLDKLYQKLPDNIIAVTGTNGKTSVAGFCCQILRFLKEKPAVIGTFGTTTPEDFKLKDEIIENSLTSPDIITLYKNLNTLKKGGINFVIIEASSIGLEQGRLFGIKFKAGVFTNFTQDHLDYHKNMDDYFAAKMILFEKILKKPDLAILNSDSSGFKEIKNICQKKSLKIITYGKSEADFCLKSIDKIKNGVEISLLIYQKKYIFQTSLVDDFQIINIICSLCVIVSYLNIPENSLKNLISNLVNLEPIKGRMERVATLKNGAQIYIDFAHSPDALKNILEITKKYSKNRLILVFGCGGDRDKLKRPIMGEIAQNFADLIFITDDNPRTENPEKIRKEIIAGINQKEKIIEIGNRKLAIKKAVSLLQKNDILIVAGKGHESYQIIGSKKLPFDEYELIKLYT